jgi:hypothetical protein
MLYKEITAIFLRSTKKHINTLWGQNVELLNVKLVVHIVTTGLRKLNFFYKKNSQLMLYREITAIFSQIHKKTHIRTVRAECRVAEC